MSRLNDKPHSDDAKKQRFGLLCMFFSAVLFSLSGLFIKFVPWSALAVNGGRTLISTSVIGLYMLITRHRLRFNRSVLIGTVWLAATTLLFVMANKLTTAANSIVLQFTAPIFIILLMWIVYRDKPKKLDVITCVIVFAGIVFFFIDGLSVGGMLGNILALLSGMTYAGVFMMEMAKEADAMSSVFFGHLLSAVIGIPFVFGETDFSPKVLLALGVLGVLDMGLGYIFFTTGLKYTKPVAASLVSGIEPILNPTWAAIFGNEYMSPLALVGAAIVLVTIVTYNCIKAKHPDVRTDPETKDKTNSDISNA